jgi:hypothetical protein
MKLPLLHVIVLQMDTQQPEDANRNEMEPEQQAVRKSLRSANKAANENRTPVSPMSCGSKRVRTDGDASRAVMRVQGTDKVPVTATIYEHKPPITVLAIWKNPVEMLDSVWKGGRPSVLPLFDQCINDEFEVDPAHTDLRLGELLSLYPLRAHIKLTSLRIAKDVIGPDGQLYPAGLSITQVRVTVCSTGRFVDII